MRTKLLCLAALIASALISTSCSDDDKNPPLRSYYQIDNGSKYAIKWAAVETLAPAPGGSYDFALSAGKPSFKPTDGPFEGILRQSLFITFEIPAEDIGSRIELVPVGAGGTGQSKWFVKIKYDNAFYETGEDHSAEDATITGGFIKAVRSGMQNRFTIDFRFSLKDTGTISGRYEGTVIESPDVHLPD